MENHEQVDYTVCNTKYLMFQVQPVQHVYPSQVQYVEGGDAVYTNGALYVVFPALGRGLTENLRPRLEPSFTTLPPFSFWGCVCTNPSPLSFGCYVGTITVVLGHHSPVEISEITHFCSFYF